LQEYKREYRRLYCLDNTCYESILEIGVEYGCVCIGGNCYIPDISKNIYYSIERFGDYQEYRDYLIEKLLK